MNRHVSGQYDSELESVRLGFMDMGGRVERQVQTAARAFVTHDAEAAETVREGEVEINRLERVLDDRCIHIIARRQPAAGDLRLLITIMKGCIDLERIGDEAEKIARMATKISHLPLPTESIRERAAHAGIGHQDGRQYPRRFRASGPGSGAFGNQGRRGGRQNVRGY